jgi:hypothetical protein
MKNKTFPLHAHSEEEAHLLAQALFAYAQAAYPPGGSECAQVSREALQESASEIAANAATESGAQLRRRQRTQMKAAVKWYFSDDGPGEPGLCAGMLRKFP